MSIRSRFASLAVLVALAGPAAGQTTYIWNNTGTDWGTAASWTPISGAGTTFPGATDVALFVPLPAGAAAQQPNLASAQAALLLTLTPNPGLGGWTFTGDGQQL